VRERVPAQIAVPPEHFVARVTLVRFVVGVREQMSLEIAALVEAALAHWTLVRRLFQVKYLVYGQRARLTEALAAFRALERFLLGMYVPGTRTKPRLVYLNAYHRYQGYIVRDALSRACYARKKYCEQ